MMISFFLSQSRISLEDITSCREGVCKSAMVFVLSTLGVSVASGASHQAWRVSGGLNPRCVALYSLIVKDGSPKEQVYYDTKIKKLLSQLTAVHSPNRVQLLLDAATKQLVKDVGESYLVNANRIKSYKDQCDALFAGSK